MRPIHKVSAIGRVGYTMNYVTELNSKVEDRHVSQTLKLL